MKTTNHSSTTKKRPPTKKTASGQINKCPGLSLSPGTLEESERVFPEINRVPIETNFTRHPIEGD